MRRITSMQNTGIAISRATDSSYDTVKIVADNIEAILASNLSLVAILRYLGASTAPPATRIDGAAVEDGDYYFDTTDGIEGIKYYDEAEDLWFVVDPSDVLNNADAAIASAAAAEAIRILVAADLVTVAADKAIVASDKATVSSDKDIVAADKAIVATDKGIVNADKVTVAADKVIVASDKATVAADKDIVASDKATVDTDKGIVATDKAIVAADRVQTGLDATATSADKVSAAASLASMATLFDSFDDKFLGTKTSDPALDNDSMALAVGAFYYNSTSLEIRFYNGTSWDMPEATSAASAAAAAISEFNAATSETNSANSASASLVSETNASTSEGNTATSESNASTSETNASNSATASSSSATSSSVSAFNSAGSETAADTHKVDAQTAATAAAADAADIATLLDEGVIRFKGDFDASGGIAPVAPLSGSDFYTITVGGIIDSVVYAVDDAIMYDSVNLIWFRSGGGSGATFTVSSTEAMESLAANKGDVALRDDESASYINTGTPSVDTFDMDVSAITAAAGTQLHDNDRDSVFTVETTDRSMQLVADSRNNSWISAWDGANHSIVAAFPLSLDRYGGQAIAVDTTRVLIAHGTYGDNNTCKISLADLSTATDSASLLDTNFLDITGGTYLTDNPFTAVKSVLGIIHLGGTKYAVMLTTLDAGLVNQSLYSQVIDFDGASITLDGAPAFLVAYEGVAIDKYLPHSFIPGATVGEGLFLYGTKSDNGLVYELLASHVSWTGTVLTMETPAVLYAYTATTMNNGDINDTGYSLECEYVGNGVYVMSFNQSYYHTVNNHGEIRVLPFKENGTGYDVGTGYEFNPVETFTTRANYEGLVQMEVFNNNTVGVMVALYREIDNADAIGTELLYFNIDSANNTVTFGGAFDIDALENPTNILYRVSDTEVLHHGDGDQGFKLITVPASVAGSAWAKFLTPDAILASQAEAEAGTESTKLMTALQTAQAIAAQAGGPGDFTLYTKDESGNNHQRIVVHKPLYLRMGSWWGFYFKLPDYQTLMDTGDEYGFSFDIEFITPNTANDEQSSYFHVTGVSDSGAAMPSLTAVPTGNDNFDEDHWELGALGGVNHYFSGSNQGNGGRIIIRNLEFYNGSSSHRFIEDETTLQSIMDTVLIHETNPTISNDIAVRIYGRWGRGATANRPTLNLQVGREYYDTEVGGIVTWNGSAWIESAEAEGPWVMSSVSGIRGEAVAVNISDPRFQATHSSTATDSYYRILLPTVANFFTSSSYAFRMEIELTAGVPTTKSQASVIIQGQMVKSGYTGMGLDELSMTIQGDNDFDKGALQIGYDTGVGGYLYVASNNTVDPFAAAVCKVVKLEFFTSEDNYHFQNIDVEVAGISITAVNVTRPSNWVVCNGMYGRGSTANRPTEGLGDGTQYYDKTIKAYIHWDGSVWVEPASSGGGRTNYVLPKMSPVQSLSLDGDASISNGTISTPSAICFDGAVYWVAEWGDKVHSYDKNWMSLSNTKTLDSALKADGITWDGNNFWVLDSDGKQLVQFDADWVATGYSFLVNQDARTGPQDVVWDGVNLCVLFDEASSSDVVKYGLDGSYNNSTRFSVYIEETNARGLTWDGTHYWVAGSSSNRIHQYTSAGVSTGLNLDLSSIAFGAYYALAWDGKDIYAVSINNTTAYRIKVDRSEGGGGAPFLKWQTEVASGSILVVDTNVQQLAATHNGASTDRTYRIDLPPHTINSDGSYAFEVDFDIVTESPTKNQLSVKVRGNMTSTGYKDLEFTIDGENSFDLGAVEVGYQWATSGGSLYIQATMDAGFEDSFCYISKMILANVIANSNFDGADAAIAALSLDVTDSISNDLAICRGLFGQGSTANRPTRCLGVGTGYYDTTIKAYIHWDGSAWVTPGAVQYQAATQSGDVAVFNGVDGWYSPVDTNIVDLIAYVTVAPVGADIIVDMLKNGSVIATVTITDGQKKSSLVTVSEAIVKDDLITFNQTQVGSTIAGETITMRFSYN